MPDTTLNKSKPRNPHPTVSDCAIIREEWAEYVRTYNISDLAQEFDCIQTFLAKALTAKEAPSALRCASLVDVMSRVVLWPQLGNSSVMTFCTITELFGILAERSGKTHVLKWKEQVKDSIRNIQYSGLNRAGIVARVQALLIGSQSSFGSLSNARKLDVCTLMPPKFLLEPTLATVVESLLPTDIRHRIHTIPFCVSGSLNQELIKQYMPTKFDYLDLCLSKDDWADRRKIQKSLHQVVYKRPSQPQQEQWSIPLDAFQ